MPAAGTHYVRVTGLNGDLDNTRTSAFEVPLVLTSVNPSTDLHPLGGNNLVIIGTGFASRSVNNAVTFDDGTLCEIESDYEVTTELRCKTQKFVTAELKTDYQLTVVVNGVS